MKSANLADDVRGSLTGRPVGRFHAHLIAAAVVTAGMLVSCGGGSEDESGENTPPPVDPPAPTVSILAPAPGRTVSGSITVMAMANVPVAGIQFQVDGTNTGVEDTEAPYSVTWNTTAAGDGPHTLTAIARNTAGSLIASAPVTVTVSHFTLPPEPPVAGRVEETDSAVTLSADWTPAGPDWYAWSGGTAVQAAVPSAVATYTFTGTSVAWIGHRSGSSGIALVKVDNGPAVQVNLFARTVEMNIIVWSMAGLSPGTHTLTISPSGLADGESNGTAIVVDAFAVPAPVISRLQETDPDVKFTGTWAQADEALGWSGGGVATVPAKPVGGARVSETGGAITELSFRGTAVNLIGYRGRDGGKAAISVDGGTAAVVDTYSPVDKIEAVVFTATGLADLPHTLKIEVLGTSNVLSTGKKVVVDAFDVTTPGRRYQEEHPSVVYSPGDWIFRNLNRTWSEGTVSESLVAGASVTFTFTGTSVSWIGCRKLSTGEADIYLDGNLVEHVSTWLPPAPPDTLAVGTEAYQTTIYRIDNLPLALHTLKIVHTSTTGSYTVIDAFDVRQ